MFFYALNSSFIPTVVFSHSGFFVGFNWEVVLIGYGGGLLAGLALGLTFSQEVFEWLKTIHLSFYFFLKERFI